MFSTDNGVRRTVELDRSQALRLLPQTSVGRLVYAANALPAIRLANFLVEDDDLYFTAVPDARFHLTDGTVVGFEADDLDASTRSGWSVTVTGEVNVVPVESTLRYLEKIDPWLPHPATRVFRLPMRLVVGRALWHEAPPREAGE